MKKYTDANPLGGPAAIFDAMAARVRAGEPFYDVLEDCGFCTVMERKALLEQLNAAIGQMKAYHDAWSAIFGALMNGGLSKKAATEQAVAFVTSVFEHRDALVKHLDATAQRQHPAYGSCDGLGPDGTCSECARVVADLREQLEQERVRLAACLTAADGFVEEPAKQGDYAWSPAYEQVLELHERLEAAERVCAAVDRYYQARDRFSEVELIAPGTGDGTELCTAHGEMRQAVRAWRAAKEKRDTE